MDEIWKPINKCPNYHISNYGNIVRIDSKGNCRKVKIISRPSRTVVSLSIGGYSVQKMVARLVLEHFISPPPGNLFDAYYMDGNSLNNHVDNLKWQPRSRSRHKTRNDYSGTSLYHGVHVLKTRWGMKWRAVVQTVYPTKQHHSKSFPWTPEGELEAAKWRDQMARIVQGDGARLNFPDVK